MYSCPTDDIHSIYIDNELPLAYIKEYEAHLQICEKCAKKLASLKSLKESLKNDSLNMKLSEEFMDKSYELLQAKMHYSKNTKKFKIYNFPADVSKIGIAAAAVIIAVILPAGISNSLNSHNNRADKVASIAPIARPSQVPITNQSVIVDGNFNDSYGMTVGTSSANFERRNAGNVPGPDGFRPPRPPMHSRSFSSSLTDVDVLRPNFDAPNKISIKINIPGLDNEDDSIEIKLPVNMLPEHLSE